MSWGPGPKNAITDVAGLKVGNAQDTALKSGATVLMSDRPLVASVSVMGGAPGTRETDLLQPEMSVAAVDALVLSGGSAYGLDACSGVVAGLRAANRGFRIRDQVIPIVPGAIIFDLTNGGDKDWVENPYPALGRAAFDAASTDFAIGTVGAGTGALSARLKGGLGTASVSLPSGHTVGALAVVNPRGTVTTPGERHFWAAPFEQGDEFGGIGPDPRSGLGEPEFVRKDLPPDEFERQNTSIAIVATDAPLSKSQCKRVATVAHDGIARAISPSHSPGDGDLVFALTTAQSGAVELELLAQVGHAASLALARAIARGVYAATPAEGDILPTWTAANA